MRKPAFRFRARRIRIVHVQDFKLNLIDLGRPRHQRRRFFSAVRQCEKQEICHPSATARRRSFLKQASHSDLASKCGLHNGPVLRDIDPRSRRGGGSVEIAAAISKGRDFLGPALPPPAFTRRSNSGSSLQPKNHRTLVAQGSNASVSGYTRAAMRSLHPLPHGWFGNSGRAAVPPSTSRTEFLPMHDPSNSPSGSSTA